MQLWTAPPPGPAEANPLRKSCASSTKVAQSNYQLLNRKVCVTGRLMALTHEELAQLVLACGGKFIRFPRRGSMILVVGEDGWPSEMDGSPSRIFERARRLRALGYPIEFQTE